MNEKELKKPKETEGKNTREEGRKRPLRDETREERFAREEQERLSNWVPKTQLGKEVKSGKIKDIEEIFKSGRKILESEIVDLLLNLKVELLDIGQAKGKFGGGKRRAWKQTQKKTKEGNVPTFAVMAVVGNEDGYVGIGYGRAKETLPAKEKAIRKAKLNIMKIQRGSGSFDDVGEGDNTLPMKVEGKCSSSVIKLIPASRGTGLVAGDEIKKILKLAGIKDIYSKTLGQTKTTINLAKATISALKKLDDLHLPGKEDKKGGKK
jgi:small subunit ribosomal protein S5